jgi:calcineurin-like phosphoesterase family protein
MADIWFISDTHFFHENILKFRDKVGSVIRNFNDVTEMNERMNQEWNSRVKPQDKVYHLGDVFVGVQFPSAAVELMKALNGHKRLMLGNHDHIEQPAYREFERIELWTGGKFKQYHFVASHIPLRHDQMRDGEYNVHGHLHQNKVCKPVELGDGSLPEVDTRYINVCVEHTGYRPVHLDEIRAMVK